MTTTTVSNASSMPAERPARDWLRVISIILCVIGLADATYLSWAHMFDQETSCPIQATIFNCDAVQHSAYSMVGPIPVAYMGFIGYVLILLALAFESRIPRARIVIFGLTLFGFLFSAYLTAMEAFRLQAYCIWCLISACILTVLFVLSFARLWQSMSILPDDEDDLAEEA